VAREIRTAEVVIDSGDNAIDTDRGSHVVQTALAELDLADVRSAKSGETPPAVRGDGVTVGALERDLSASSEVRWL
jgi:hypothetical protein